MVEDLKDGQAKIHDIKHKTAGPYKSKKRSVVWECNTNGPQTLTIPGQIKSDQHKRNHFPIEK